MSKAGNTIDSDDILSSIRKLVANNLVEMNTEDGEFTDRVNASIAEITGNEDTESEQITKTSGTPKVSVRVEKKSASQRKATVDPLILSADMATDVLQLDNPITTNEGIKTEPELTGNKSVFVSTASNYDDVMPAEQTDSIVASEPTDIVETEQDDTDRTAQYIDEDVLQDVVSKMVRLELQGDLGDKITRNVRKLVRQEIQHAITSKDIL